MRLKNPLPPKCPPRHLHVVTLLEQSAWWTTESSPGYASPPETKSQKDGRWKTSTLGDGVSRKTPRGRQRETTSLYFPRHTGKKMCPINDQNDPLNQPIRKMIIWFNQLAKDIKSERITINSHDCLDRFFQQ